MKISNICIYFITSFLCLVIAPKLSHSAQKAASVIEDGYAGSVLQKILSTGKIQPTNAGTIKLYVNEEGKLTDCRKIKGNDTQALCAAAKIASPYGTPPYGVNTNLVISFWVNDKDHINKKSSSTPEKTAQANNDPSYLAKITKELRNSIYIPKETKKGTYHATVQLTLAKNGHIEKSSILKTSGDTRLDKYILQGLERAAKVSPPPATIKNPVELTFTLKR